MTCKTISTIFLLTGWRVAWRLLAVSCLSCLLLLQWQPVAARTANKHEMVSQGRMIVKVTGFKSDKGELRAVLYENQKAFDDDRRFKQATAIISNRTATATLSDVPVGTYAVAVFHDANQNGELDENWLGFPKENYGLSRNVPASIRGIPTFEQIKIEHSGAETIVEIKLQK